MANVEKIRTAISNIDGEVLKDTLAILLSSGNGSGESSVKSANSSSSILSILSSMSNILSSI